MAKAGQKALSGAATGAGIGSAFGPVGTAVGAAVGGIGGALAGMGGSSGDLKKYVKQQFANLMDKGTTVSDEEQAQIQQATVDAQSQVKAAQDLGAQRQGMALTGGTPILAGKQKQSAKELGEATREIAQKATAQGKKMVAALDDRRKAALIQRMSNIADKEDQQAQQDVQTGLALADAGAEIAKLV